VPGRAPPLLLMHGAEGSQRMFDALVPHLAPRFTVIAYDQRDCGETENPPSESTLADLASDAQALLHEFGHARAHVYGTSFGGRVAQTLAHRAPDAVDRLVLGSTWALPTALDELNPEGVAQIRALRANLPESAEALAAFFFPNDFLHARPEFKALFRSAQPRTDRSLRRVRTVDDRPTLEPARIAAPTLVLTGVLDCVVPPHVQRTLARAIPDAQQVELDGVGHAGAVQAPERIASAIRRFCLDEAKETA